MARTRGNQVGEYEILEVLGEGAFGVVFKARHIRSGRIVALKWAHPHACRDEGDRLFRETWHKQILHSYQQESIINARLYHENVNLLLGSGVEGDWPFLVTQYQPMSLETLLLEKSRLSVEEALRIAKQITEALAFAHEHQVIHMDLKPSNILLDEEGNVKLADFGISKGLDLLPGGSASVLGWGSLEYMSPEQLDRKDPDPKMDVYALGVLMFEMLTGDVPFHGDRKRVRRMQLDLENQGKLPSARQRVPEVPEWLDEVVQKAMNPGLRERWQMAGELKVALERQGQQPRPISEPTSEAKVKWGKSDLLQEPDVKIMTYTITEECINCGACEPECPEGAIMEGDPTYVVDPARCTGCVGAYDSPRCAEVCPVDACVPTGDVEALETRKRLSEEQQRLNAPKWRTMTNEITEECINCGACEPECPNEAISEGYPVYVIDPDKCTKCVGAYASPRCVEVCPVDACVSDPDRDETKEQLLEKWRALHPGEEPAAGT